jgi:hypothetical protein
VNLCKKWPISCRISGHPDPKSDRRQFLGAQELLKIEHLLLDFGVILAKSGQILHVSEG